ncbi:MAG: hypothetical protein KGL53_00815, partial [Elusimicrobia bacterium]|nr:hypothetical protein [Elusimicrobiota bacterium]
TFHWEQRMLNLPHASMRGVDKRLCELSEFVLLKDGRLGPPDAVGGLEEAAKQIKDPDGWFASAYQEDARWALPDGSAAVLYRQRRDRPNPVPAGRIDYTYFETGGVELSGLSAKLEGWERDSSAWKNATVAVSRLEDRGLVVSGLKVEAGNLSLVPVYGNGTRRSGWSDLRLLRLDRLTVDHLQIDQSDLMAFVSKRVPGLRLTELTLDGTIRAAGEWHGKPVSLEAALDLDRAARVLRVRILSAQYMGTPIPASLFRPIQALSISLAPNPETPFAIDLPGLTIKNGRLTVP